jgi:diguanylate cyclase (GGDEF)-like protein
MVVTNDSPPGAGVMSAEQERRLLALQTDMPLSDEDEWLASIASHVSAILGTRAAMLRKRDRRWAAAAPQSAIPWASGREALLDRLTRGTAAVRVEYTEEGSAPWSLVTCATHPPLVLAAEGDWGAAVPTFVQLAEHISRAHRARVQALRARSGLAAHRLARRLARAHGLAAVYDTIVRRMPAIVRARVAALAVPDPADGRLTIVATHGYPRELVEHVRIERRTGVFGAVFDSGRLMHVRRFSPTSGRRRRARYRTDSFVAMPLVSGSDVLGVIAVTDRFDDKPFTSADVTMLRAMAAPAALALGREFAVKQAEGYAMTAAIDSLSGTFNRRHFHVRLEEELQRARRHSLSLGFLMIDIDDFKSINDTYGHLAGDTVIRDVADILRRSVRVFDVCARFGGEEFAIIMPGSAVESAAIVAERIRERIEAYRPLEPGLEQLAITVSIGLAVSTPEMTPRDLIARADHALYQAKRAGKNRVRIAGDAPGTIPGGPS